MFSRIQIALVLALLLTLLTSITVFAKGSFSFIEITGAKLKDEVRLSDPALTTDFFTFADFYRNKTETPIDPGVGYEITRYYLDGSREIAFDKFHYYPDTGFVYYDGIVNGSSEYDGKWYTAQPEIKSTFETALFTQIRLAALGTEDAAKAMVPPSQPIQPNDQNQVSAPITQPQSTIPIIVMVGMAVIIVASFLKFRRLSPR
jgi:hypothetical protein